jgi:hypothetical protein
MSPPRPIQNADGLYSVPLPFQFRLSPPQANPAASMKIKFACGFFKNSSVMPKSSKKASHTSEHVVAPHPNESEKRAVPDARSTYTDGGRPAMNFRADESRAPMGGCCAAARAVTARKQLVESAYRFTSKICSRGARARKRCGAPCLSRQAAPERFPTPHSPLAANRLEVRLIF